MTSERKGIVVSAAVQAAVGALVGIVVGTVTALGWFDGRYVTQKEHGAHEAADKSEVRRIDATLSSHIELTRTDAVRLATIEAQLSAIREDLRWLREHAERKIVR